MARECRQNIRMGSTSMEKVNVTQKFSIFSDY